VVLLLLEFLIILENIFIIISFFLERDKNMTEKKYKYFSTGEVAKKLKINKWKIFHLLETGKIGEPQRIGGKRIFSEDEVLKIKDELKQAKMRKERKNLKNL
jgi:hypothetical protein